MKLNKDITTYKRKSKDMEDFDEKFLTEFEQFTLDKKCLGLAAPEVGKFIRLITVKSKDRKRCTVMCNPTIVKQSAKSVASAEHCLIPGASQELHKMRPKWVKVEYYDYKRNKLCRKTFYKRFAAAACHCLEILDGTLFIT